MKNITAWMKANVAIVVLCAVIILSLPAAFVGSNMWNGKIRKGREAAAAKAMQDLDAQKITYMLPSVLPGEQAKPLVRPVANPKVTEYFKAHRQALEQQINEVSGVAKEMNSKGHAPLLDGVLPTPAGTIKALDFADLIVGKGDKPSVYQDLLKSINAGGPADPVGVADVLHEIEEQFKEKVRSDTSRDKLTTEEEAELQKKLVEARIGQYQQRAGEISVYATRDCLPAGIPRVAPNQPPEAIDCFLWQYDYWVVSDLLRAVDAANGGPDARVKLKDAAVKRVDRITLDPPTGPSEATITGRKNSPENKLYDVRNASLSLVVASSKLPEVVNAISRTNFMTVVGMDFHEIDPWADLDQGYYYGAEHVVRADLRIETIWLRSWTEPLMPQAYKDLVAPSAEAVAAAAPSPPPAPAARGKGSAPDADATPSRGKPKPPPKQKQKPQQKNRRGGGDLGG